MKNERFDNEAVVLLKTERNNILKYALSLYCSANKAPLAEEVLCCYNHITEEQITIFLQRTILTKASDGKMSCVINPNGMSYQLNKFFVNEYKRLKDDIKDDLQFLLVIIAAEDAKEVCDIASYFQNHLKTNFPMYSSDDKLKTDVAELILKCEPNCDRRNIIGRLVQSSSCGNGKTMCANSIRDRNIEYYGFCCVPIHKRECDRGLIIERFLDGIKTQKESGKCKMIYLVDISPAVWEGADLFIFEVIYLSFFKFFFKFLTTR